VKPSWYIARLRRMEPSELTDRVQHEVRRRTWRRHQVAPGAADPLVLPSWPRRPPAPLPAEARAQVASEPRRRLLEAADALMDGRWELFGSELTDMVDPDWHADPTTGRRAPSDVYCFDVPYRDEAQVGNVKVLWERSRHHHLTVLAAAYHLTGDERYAERAGAHVRSWLAANPPLTGVQWTSGIELGIRLISWVWTRRLLHGWDGAPAVFEANDDFARSVWHHQRWLAGFYSAGSSANNHVVAEAAGQLVASCAFPWFEETPAWRRDAKALLEKELEHNTFPSGLNRELATDYHALVLELGVAAAIEAELAGAPLASSTLGSFTRMCDAIATIVDVAGHPPRQGDGDDGLGLLLDAPHWSRWFGLLATGARLGGALPWWPRADADVRTVLWCSIARPWPAVSGRSTTRPGSIADAGMVLLHDGEGADELWVRGDLGPHGFLGIAAHGHADALAVEVRVGGVDVIADPGTYCYHGEPEWRALFRSTVGHATLEVGGTDQSKSGGPFLWTRHATTTALHQSADGWEGVHDGYAEQGVKHRRSVSLDRERRALAISDVLEGTGHHDVRLAFPLGPGVDADIEGSVAALRWMDHRGVERRAVLSLPETLRWRAHRGEEQPPMGWFSPGFGQKVPAFLLVGTGRLAAGEELRSELQLS
jgi:hypothetical protein